MTPRALGPSLVLALLGAQAVAAPAPDPAPPGGDETDAALEQARDRFAAGQFAAARDLLSRAYERSHRADILFALGQAEFNLENFEAAIGYYEQYLATNPDAERTALTQQALGAARARIAAPKPPPPPKMIERHRWTPEYTGLIVLGVAGIGIGTALLVHGHGLGDNAHGTLADYEQRIQRSENEQIAGLACTIGGAVAIGAALVAWRVRTETVLVPRISERAVGVALGGRW